MKVRIVRDRNGQAVAMVALEPINPEGVDIEPVLEEGEEFEDVEATRRELSDPESFLQRYSHSK